MHNAASPHPKIREAYRGMLTRVTVFAGCREDAKAAVVDKMRYKWLRHRDLPTQWITHNVVEG